MFNEFRFSVHNMEGKSKFVVKNKVVYFISDYFWQRNNLVKVLYRFVYETWQKR